jgi:ABC-type multidrug transport system fused ATPase/permease subunit
VGTVLTCFPVGKAELIKDIGEIPLGHVRSELGIIAQDPILLSGSLRLNLDIEGKFTDDELYDALHQVQLLKRATSTASSTSSESEETVVEQEDESQRNIFANLDYEIKSGGEK